MSDPNFIRLRDHYIECLYALMDNNLTFICVVCGLKGENATKCNLKNDPCSPCTFDFYVEMIRSPHTKALAHEMKTWTDYGHCPFCFTNQDMLENQSCCTECGEPLEEGRCEDDES